jgi:hypothetical protein
MVAELLTPEMVQGSFVGMIILYVVAFAFQVYMLFLNYKQSKVNNQMSELVKEVKEIKKLLKEKKKK